MQRNIHFLPRAICVSRSIARPIVAHNDRAPLVSWLVGTALIATALLGLLFPLGSSTPSWKFLSAPSSSAASGVVPNRAAKGDRLPVMHRTDRDSSSTRADPRPTQKTDRGIPVGCDGAFSKLVKSENFAARCVTAVDAPTKFASADNARSGASRF